MGKNSNGVTGKTIGLLIFTIACLIVLFGGLAGSYVFWRDNVNGQFGLFIPFTFLFFVLMNIIFKIPSLIDIVLLIINMIRSARLNDTKSRIISVVSLSVIAVSVVICVVVEFIMFVSTQGSSLG